MVFSLPNYATLLSSGVAVRSISSTLFKSFRIEQPGLWQESSGSLQPGFSLQIVGGSIHSAQKMITSGDPLYMHNALSTIHPLRTRQAAGGQIRIGENFSSKQGLLHDSFKYRAAKDYNSIPVSLWSTRCLQSFKIKLIKCVRFNIPVG